MKLHATKLSRDFAECGANKGNYSLFIRRYVDFNRMGKQGDKGQVYSISIDSAIAENGSFSQLPCSLFERSVVRSNKVNASSSVPANMRLVREDSIS